MVTKLKEVDVVAVGLGWTGAILARELTKAGLNVVALEKGQDRVPGQDFTIPAVRDELRWSQRLELMWDNSIDTLTFRNFPNEQALPIRRIGAFLPGEGVGGSGIHWGALHWRFLPSDFRIRSALTERYGANALPDGMTIQDWPVSYDEMEPFYDQFDKICGASGTAGNLRGNKVAGGNVFEGPRASEYPNAAIKSSNAGLMFGEASKSLGYHPFPAPVAIASSAYNNPENVALGACEYCGFCNRIACETNAKASANSTILPALRLDPKFEMRTRTFVTKLNYDKAAKRVVSVSYVDKRNGEEYEQPANIVLLTSYVFSNVQHMLLAGIGEPYDRATGKGVVGKNYAYQFEAGASAFFENKEMNPYWGSAGMGVVIDDFNGENFDHGGLGFFGGGYIMASTAAAPPMAGRTVPHGTPEWGADWKRATAKWYYHAARFNTQGSVYANRDNFMDLDPTYKDAFGRPLIRLTYNPPDNEFKMSAYLLNKLEGAIKAMNPTSYDMHPRPKTFTVVPYQSTHNTGGTMMGSDPKSSAVNRYLQAWDAHNLFIQGASVFPQQHGYNPTGTVGALAYWSAKAITQNYLKNPGPLVHA
jgi:gluconate 2-dehydrogenase alpha chain